MSTASNRPRPGHHRYGSVQSQHHLARNGSASKRRAPDFMEVYLWALRVAYLVYLLQPRTRRLQHTAAPTAPPPKTSIISNDVLKDLSSWKDSSSARLPKGFMADLEKRIASILMNQDKRPEYNEPVIKKTFAEFYNKITDKARKKALESDRRVEDLMLHFYTCATNELQAGRAPGDDAWKLMVDRYVALFIRLISATLQEKTEKDWARSRPELTHKLKIMEEKLLKHDQDIAAASAASRASTVGKSVEVLVERSYKVKDMPLVMHVGRVFSLTNTMLQSDIDKYKSVWTLKAALADLKTYQLNLNLNTRFTLRDEDFDTRDAFQAWKKAEDHPLSQMMLNLLQTEPELAKAGTGGQQIPHPPPGAENSSHAADMGYANTIRPVFDSSEGGSLGFDQPVDMSGLNLGGSEPDLNDNQEHPFTFIPPDTRAYYKFALSQIFAHEVRNQPSNGNAKTDPSALFSKQSTELINVLCLRWRIPHFTRVNLFLDVVKDEFCDQQIDLEMLDAALMYADQLNDDPSLSSQPLEQALEVSNWTMADFTLHGHIISALHDALLRDLFAVACRCYEPKAPSVGGIMVVLDTHIYSDPQFSQSARDQERFTKSLQKGMEEAASEMYKEFVTKVVPENTEEWQFYHIIQLGKTVLGLIEKLQKKYRKMPEIMGANPKAIFIQEALPHYVKDSHDMIVTILDRADQTQVEVPTEDGFELYESLVDIRRIHQQVLPEVEFDLPIEEFLAPFVWRVIEVADLTLVKWAENAFREDEFQVRNENPNQDPTDDEKHSTSVIDINRAFGQTVKQILALGWQDEFQYAKFMTAMTKCIGNAVARYVELVEEKFNAEMDRLSPDQEAALTNSRQERWMQIAKDTWNNKEKIEPFQFYPESFVKLNNIEWVLYRLDDLQRTINVDACIRIMEKHAPPASRRPNKAGSYVFTIKVIEAEDLMACDLNGLSDPYVVLGDERKRLGKTRTIYSTLNPRWDETFEITTRSPVNIVATVWDWDSLKNHDYVGRTQLKLDPAHFSDYLPQEHWLKLDSQGQILLRISMEGEQDDIQFYCGKAFRTVRRTQREMVRKITDKLSAYIHHCLSRQSLRSILSKGVTASVSSFFSRNRQSNPVPQAPTDDDISLPLRPLVQYFNDNFSIMRFTLTESAMVMVMARLWKEVLTTIESLLIPPLSDKPSAQKPLNQQEVDAVYKWLQFLFEFFNARDLETGESLGVPQEQLKTPKYNDLHSLAFFYSEPTNFLIHESERMASQAAARARSNNRVSAPQPSTGSLGAMLTVPGGALARSKSIMITRNLGTMRKAKEEKRKEAQAEQSDDIILRILRMRPEAERYLKDRSRQKEKQAAADAAAEIVNQSIAQGAAGRRKK
ncbi:MAG: hypothetical protein M1814_000751 [Vezdaea aestivalis]|nr:MAG: hypothetical protein M1814_000751 [Vezdaea aestivalis]